MVLTLFWIVLGCAGGFLLRWEIMANLWGPAYYRKLVRFDKRLVLRFGGTVVTGISSIADSPGYSANQGDPAETGTHAGGEPDSQAESVPNAGVGRAIRAAVGRVLFIGFLSLCLAGCIAVRLVYVLLETITAEPNHLKEANKEQQS